MCSELSIVAAQAAVCTPELTAMLSCWAATGDLHNMNLCRETAQSLFQCMRTAVRFFYVVCSFV